MKTLILFRLATVSILLVMAIGSTGCNKEEITQIITPTVHEDLVTVWRPVSVTIDDVSVPVAEFFEFSEGALTFNLIISSDATYRTEELDSSDQVLHFEDGTAVSFGQTLTLTMTSDNGAAVSPPVVVAAGTFDVTGVTLTFTMEDGDAAIVLVFNNWLS